MPKSSKIWLETLKTEYKVSILFGIDSLEPIRVRYRFYFVDSFMSTVSILVTVQHYNILHRTCLPI